MKFIDAKITKARASIFISSINSITICIRMHHPKTSTDMVGENENEGYLFNTMAHLLLKEMQLKLKKKKKNTDTLSINYFQYIRWDDLILLT